jgi:hypothetical protein
MEMQMQHPLEELHDRFVLQNADADDDPVTDGDNVTTIPAQEKKIQ